MKDDERRQMTALHAQLLREYGDRHGPDTVSARFARIVAEFEDAPVRAFVPLLAQRRIRQELSKAAGQV